jgi:hypothetical protein
MSEGDMFWDLDEDEAKSNADTKAILKKVLLKRSSGYIDLDVVVRAHDTMRNTINYGILCPDGKVAWMIKDDGLEGGARREAEIIFRELGKIANI